MTTPTLDPSLEPHPDSSLEPDPVPDAAWAPVCPVAALEIERGRAALVDDVQVALFLLHDGSVRAVANHDPYSGANVISRGIVGSRAGAPTVASPLYKQVFDLTTGECLDTQGKEPKAGEIGHLRAWEARVRSGEVELLWTAAR
ncbi:nitrite reductase small subunit NirD [Brachybacterium sp. DNPG3]